MGGPSGHGQHNKAHKSGSKGLSARQKHRLGKEAVPTGKAGSKAGVSYAGAKLDRQLAAKQHRDVKRAELLDKRRRASSTPLVVALLPLSQDVDVGLLWSNLLSACGQTAASVAQSRAASEAGDGPADDDIMIEAEGPGDHSGPQAVCTVCVAGRAKLRLTLLPPVTNRSDPMAVVAMARLAEVVLLAVPGGEHAQAVDADGDMALTVLRALGMPEVVLAVQGCSSKGAAGGAAGLSMKERSAARKRAEKAVGAVVAGDHKAYCADEMADCVQLVRHLAERPAPALPHWRQQRPALMVEAAEYMPAAAGGNSLNQEEGQGQLLLSGWVRVAGLSANQLVTVAGVGDFQIERIEGVAEPQAQAGKGQQRRGGMEQDMDMGGQQPIILAQVDPEARESLARENVGGGSQGDGEQTWPSAAELEDAAQQAIFERRKARRKLPEGTSEYQAAWLVDEDDDDDGSQESEEEEAGQAKAMQQDGDEGEGKGLDVPDLEEAEGMAMDDGDDSDGADSVGTQAGASRWARLQAEKRALREAEGQDATYPDELDVPVGVAARQRLQKYRGLKSFRSSPWDVKEWLPQEYSRVFAFQNLRRAHKRALAEVARATAGVDPCAVEPGTWVRLVLRGVSPEQGQAVLERVAASGLNAAGTEGQEGKGLEQPPLVVFGLLTHEAKLSVVHFSVTKAAGYADPLPNKELLTLVTGLRTFPARPVFSADTPGDKHKMERWLRPGRPAMASVYAPISYPPLPLLAFKEDAEGGPPRLAATGALRSCNPDRVTLKKIVLTGYPVRVHKKRCTVRFMFHDPDDVRWFRPVELYTRSGRRGRITEALGTHGTFKALFDGPVQQREVVCMSLYKRVYPTCPATPSYPAWPDAADLTFA